MTRNVKVSLLVVAASISLLASAACGGAGQAPGGSAAEAEVERETAAREHARPVATTAEDSGGPVARAGGADGAVARAGGAVARADDARAQAGAAAREEDGGEAPDRDTVGEDSSAEGRPEGSSPQDLMLRVGGDPGTAFSGVCSVGKREKTIEGRVPERYAFEPDAAGIDCEIRKEDGGALEVVIAREGFRSVQRTGAGEGTIRFAFSEDGISSSTSSTY